MSIIKPQLSTTPRRGQPSIPASLIFCSLLICLGCAWLGLQVAGPLQQAAKLHAENDALERDLHRARIQNQKAEKQAQSLGTEQGIIIAARMKGYMFPQEHPLHMHNDPGSQSSPPKTP